MMNRTLVLCVCVGLLLAAVSTEALETPPDPARVQAVAAMLPAQPMGPGPSITDRVAWDKLAALPDFQRVITQAADLAAQPIPDQPDDLFLEYSRTGNRTHWQDVAGKRRGRLVTLVLAECLENKGRFLPAISQIVDALCAEKTWVMPAHDGSLANFHGKTIDIDLGSSALGWNMALTDALLGDRLTPATRQTLRDNVRRRILEPYQAMIRGKRPVNWWMTTNNNWNAVCLAGVTGAGLAELPTRQERAEFIVAAEKYVRNFLAGFTPDGYCSEGLGYWDYGFGHYALLAETIRRATGGKEDLLNWPNAHAPALFGARIQIMNGVSPAFADCPVNAQPTAPLMHLLNARFGLGLPQYDTLSPRSTLGSLFEALVYNFPNAAPAMPATTGKTLAETRLRDWFDKAGILVARPAPQSACRLGVALKGGNNAENHNHNDVGSYVVVTGDRPVLLDPGPETYTARTFGPHRYDSKLLNSFGHPVPLVAGKLQREGKAAQGKVRKAQFTPETDTVQMDIASAYPVPELKTLERTFVYSRAGTGALTVTDQVTFSSAQSFGTAVLTKGGWKRQPDGSLLVYDGDQALRVTIDAGGQAYTLDPEEIHEDAPVTPTRLGINLTQPVTSARIMLHITPADLPSGNALLRNGGFELGALGWDLPRAGMGTVSTEQAASGTASLKIADDDPKLGSDVSSIRLPAVGGKDYVLRGKIYQVSGEGLGLYVKYFDPVRTQINPAEANGNIAPVGTVKGAPGHWEPFSLRFHTPSDTATMQLWIHSFSTARTTAYLDDLEIAPGAGR